MDALPLPLLLFTLDKPYKSLFPPLFNNSPWNVLSPTFLYCIQLMLCHYPNASCHSFPVISAVRAPSEKQVPFHVSITYIVLLSICSVPSSRKPQKRHKG